MKGFETIIYEKKEGIAYIILDRPQALNAVNVKMRDELYEVLPAIEDDPEVMVAIIRGAGERAFSVGADISEFGTAPSRVIARQVHLEREVWRAFFSINKPLVAAIHGFALGAGIEMAMCCDIRLASEDACFGLPEVNLAMIPPAGGSQTMPRLVTLGRASEIILTGDRIDASEALRIGLINRVFPHPSLLTAAEEIARKIISYDQLAMRCAKEAINRGINMPLEQGLELEKRLFARLSKRAV